MRRLSATGLFLAVLVFGGPASLRAQAATLPLPSWRVGPLLPNDAANQRWVRRAAPLTPLAESLGTRSHTRTGLLIGGIIGTAAATVFLVGFCSDPDTKCGADEVGRAVVLIALPPAAAGALIGSLIRTKR